MTSTSLNRESPIFVFCNHGRTRSRLLKTVLIDMGYTSVFALGVRDALNTFQSDPDLKKLFEQAAIVICAKSDVLAELLHVGSRLSLSIPENRFVVDIPEKDHHFLSMCRQNPTSRQDLDRIQDIKNAIMEKLLGIGFVRQDTYYATN